MTKTHRSMVLNCAPTMLRRTFTLEEACQLLRLTGATTVAELATARSRFSAHAGEDVRDPIGCDEQTFLEVGIEVAELLSPLLAQLRG